jgi:site-specific DNA recombinase
LRSIKNNEKKADDLWLEIIDEFIESMSAKEPWRYKFNEMIQRIKKWEAYWIVAWKLDRLSRNPIDSWEIQFMLQRWILNNIITNDREYNITDSWLLMSVENWMSNQFLLDLSKNVKRWMNSKADKWWFPWPAPEWYKNNRDDNTIIPDINNFELLQKVWWLMITWNYSIKKIIDIANNEWWYRTKIKKNSWWKKLRTSTMYFMFNNIFYTWNFLWNWKIYKWNHKPMITLEQFERVQELLWDKWKSKELKHNFSLTWLIQCWECWASITAWVKKKFNKATSQEKLYHYYWCTKNKWCSCNQNGIREEELEKQIDEILSEIEIISDFKDWAISIIKSNYKEEQENLLENKDRLLVLERDSKKKLNDLVDLLLDWIIDKSIYNFKKNYLEKEILSFQREIEWIEWKRKQTINDTEKVFDFAVKARSLFKFWNSEVKRIILKNLGLHFVLKDWKLLAELSPWFQVIKNNREYIWINNSSFTPKEKGISKWLLIPSNSIIPIWQGVLELHQCLPASETDHSSN